MIYYTGLSILPNYEKTTECKQKVKNEARRILSCLYGKNLTDDDFVKEKSGRPFLPDSGIDFNISHSGALAAVSFVSEFEKKEFKRTGCDIEFVRQRVNIRNIAKKYFHCAELEYILAGGESDPLRFYHIWTLKESYIKLKGLSLFDMAACPGFINTGQLSFCKIAGINYFLYELTSQSAGTYVLATCVEETAGIKPVIKWFSQTIMDCGIITEN
jgi:phosphopantetheinyl transferase